MWTAVPLAVALVASMVCYARIRHTYFIFDDFLNFAIYIERGLSVKAYVFHTVFGQIVPGYRLTQALVFELFGPNNVATILIISLMSGVAAGLAFSICRKLHDDVWLLLPVAVLLIFSYQQLDAQLWWASSLHTFPGLIAALAMIRLLLSQVRQSEAWGALALACGLAFYSKTLFSLIFAFGLLVALDERERLWARLTSALWKMRYAILVAGAYAILIAFVAPRIGGTRANAGSVLLFLWQSFADASIAATLGLGSHGASIGPLTLLPGLVVLVAIVAWSIYLSRLRAAVVWLGLAAYFLVSMSVIGIVRSGHFPEAGLWPRYSIENVVFLLIAIVAAFGSHNIPSGLPRFAAAVGAVVAAAVLQVQSSHIYHPVDYRPIRHYVERLRTALMTMPPGAILADTEVPEHVMGAWMAPFNRARLFVPIYSRVSVRPREQATFEITPEGAIRPMR